MSLCVGVMVELSNLMSRVADQPSGSSTPQWQHPSDLTCRYAVPVLHTQITRQFSHRIRFNQRTNVWPRAVCLPLGIIGAGSGT